MAWYVGFKIVPVPHTAHSPHSLRHAHPAGSPRLHARDQPLKLECAVRGLASNPMRGGDATQRCAGHGHRLCAAFSRSCDATRRCTGPGHRLCAAFPRPRAPPHTAAPAPNRVRVTAGPHVHGLACADRSGNPPGSNHYMGCLRARLPGRSARAKAQAGGAAPQGAPAPTDPRRNVAPVMGVHRATN